MPPRSCRVTITDSRGIKHSAEVTADSLFEAAIRGIQILRKADWAEDPIGGSTVIEIEICEAITSHRVTLLQVQRWLDAATISPNERVKKERLRQMLKAM